MNKKPDHLSSITQSRHSAGISSYFSLPWKETNPPPRFCVGRAWPHSRHHALESSTGEIMWPELCQGQTPLWSSKLSVFYPDVKDKTKQEPTNQPTVNSAGVPAVPSLGRSWCVTSSQLPSRLLRPLRPLRPPRALTFQLDALTLGLSPHFPGDPQCQNTLPCLPCCRRPQAL